MAGDEGWLLAAASALSLLTVTPETASAADDLARWQQEAAAVTIMRDDWGIAHVHGNTDADAVFGMIYAQAEDDFNRVETNYLTSLGRPAEAEGEKAIWTDLRQRLFSTRGPEGALPAKPRLAAAADGCLGRWAELLPGHPSGREAARDHALRALDGAELHRRQHRRRYRADLAGGWRPSMAKPSTPRSTRRPSPCARSHRLQRHRHRAQDTANGHALLLINPHTSFFFRSELQMSSDEGLDAYGAVTWGQFFIYQGFNQHIGWMHTSTGVDNVDEFAETIVRKDGKLFYRYGTELRPVTERTIVVPTRRQTA